ncbi:hypothetical protein OSB04_029650 [Centaurea solstitialis]|uniref:Uncharacterized protein n=1 Tax=Centaurea solstitialis TaxID=347529 RepID=A0AA38VSG2_9ASTR|nr:hypothetical protein OSB04_029650 [Centaurea solstitialis]
MRNDTETSINIDDVPVPTNTITTFPYTSVNGFIFGPLQRLMAYLVHLWTNCYPLGGVFGEEGGPLMPGSAFNFIIGGLFAFFALAEHVLSLPRPPPAPTSVSAILARFGSRISLVIFVGSLTYLSYI